MNDLHPFDHAMRLDDLGDGRRRGHTSPAYANMVGPFGGVIAAVMLRAPMDDPAAQGEPTALTVNYCGPIADGPFEIASRAVRTNRSNQHWTMALAQGDDTLATGTAVFAHRRDVWGHAQATMPEAPAAATVARADTTRRLPWTQRYDMRFVSGPLPDLTIGQQPGADPTTLGWYADDPPRPLDYPSLAAMCDAFFPRIYMRRPRFVPIGTVSLTIYFHATRATLEAQSDRPVLGKAWANHFGHGIYDEHAEMWSDAGELLATAHQVVYYKE